MNHRRAAYLGPPGTFSHEAAVQFFQSRFELVPGRTASEVIRCSNIFPKGGGWVPTR